MEETPSPAEIVRANLCVYFCSICEVFEIARNPFEVQIGNYLTSNITSAT